MSKARKVAEGNRPAAAAGLAGAVSVLLVALAEWGMDVLDFAANVPDNVQVAGMAVLVALATMVGGVFGKIAQRMTWPDQTHKAAVSLALQLAPEEWAEAVEALGMTREEALEAIGATEDEVP